MRCLMKKILPLVFLMFFFTSLYAETNISFKIPVLSVHKNKIGNCSRIDFEYKKTDKKEPLYIGYREDTPAGTGEVIKGSLWLAGITAALQRNASMSGVKITIDFKDYTDGPSAGGIICLAILTAMDGRTMPADFAMTGTIMPDGTIGLVGGIQYKLKAAGKAKIKRVCIPAGKRFEEDYKTHQEVDLDQIARDNGIELFYVKNIQEAYCIMHGLAMPKQEYLSDRNITKLSNEIELVAAELFDEGVRIFEEGIEKITKGDKKKLVELQKNALWNVLNIEKSQAYRRSDHYLLAINTMKLPISAWGTIGDTFSRFEKIRKRHPNYEKNKSAKIDYLLDLSESAADTFISKYFQKRIHEKFRDLEQNNLRDRLTQDIYGEGIRPEIPQNDIPAQLEDVNRFSQSIQFARLLLEEIPTKDKLMNLNDKKLDELIEYQQEKIFISAILGRMDAINKTYLRRLSSALPQMSANADVDIIEHIFYATGMAACKMYEAGDLPVLKKYLKRHLAEQLKEEKINKTITDEEIVEYLGNRNSLFLSWRFAKDDSMLMHHNKRYTEYKSYHDIAAIKSHILLFTMTHALMVEVNRGNNISHLIDCARHQAIFNILECKKQNIPCVQAIAYFEKAEVSRDQKNANRTEDILVNYWNASLIAKALMMSFSKIQMTSESKPEQQISLEEKRALLKKAIAQFKAEHFNDSLKTLSHADQNDPQVRFLLGVLYYSGELENGRNIPLAVDHLKFAAASGKNEAYYPLGLCYLRVNIKDAITAFESGANLGDVKCQYMLGKIYMRGIGTKKNYQKAQMWFRKAADQGFSPAIKAYETLFNDEK